MQKNLDILSIYKYLNAYDIMGDIEMAVLIFFIGIFNLIDYFCTDYLLKLGAEELNPFMKGIVNNISFPIIKLLIFNIILIFLWKYRNKGLQTLLPKLLLSLTFSCYLLLMLYYGTYFLNI